MNQRRLRIILKVLLAIVLVWTGFTLWVQYSGKEFVKDFQAEPAYARALIVFNPDPVYSLDEQVCTSFAEGLKMNQVSSTLATVTSAESFLDKQYDLYVFCVNTYNWTPDWRLTKFIKSHPGLNEKNVVAITVGAGATMRAQRKLEWHLSDQGARLLGSEMYWLLKPNDKSRMKEKNTAIAAEKAFSFGQEIGSQITKN